MTSLKSLWVLAALAFAGVAHAAPVERGDLVSLPTRAGVTQGIFIASSSPHPPWVVVLFGGAEGALGLGAGGATALQGNFLIRSAQYWVSHGWAAVLVDTPSDKARGVDGDFRLSAESFTDTQAIVAALRQRFPGSRIALVGTSAGTVSVGNALQRKPGLADAYVLTSPLAVARRGNTGISRLDADGAKYPVLVVSNQSDSCPASLSYAAKDLANRDHFDLVLVDSTRGGGDKNVQCGGRSPHGFLGIEGQVLDDIGNWLNGRPPAGR
jgi:pimeloyl-ACP methyl ester carboxylesterase